ncbi:GNAT family N-acetyltransferase [Saccharomonospora sp.]|uniref:GNAT family N-acetyltransferase n=1 Tax=Saccharomonospora sp. TaxID=33913 RepID=UPI0026234003|nr:GNAT family N-acetyltransferase [Saccharomonospora sp.]
MEPQFGCCQLCQYMRIDPRRSELTQPVTFLAGASALACPPTIGPSMPSVQIRPYNDADAQSWLRCRLLSFFPTQYYDDVVIERPNLDEPSIRLVGVIGADVVGILDVSISDDAATIETVAVLPEHARTGTATRLLHAALPELRRRKVRTLDAWTREDPAANAWYQANGFDERFDYLHVYKEPDEDNTAFAAPEGVRPVRVFAHAPIELEAHMRARFRRVYVCRQYILDLKGAAPSTADYAQRRRNG